MNVACNKCGAEYRIDETKIPPNGGAIRCTRCGERFQVMPPSASIPLPGATAVATHVAAAIPLPAAAPSSIPLPAAPPSPLGPVVLSGPVAAPIALPAAAPLPQASGVIALGGDLRAPSPVPAAATAPAPSPSATVSKPLAFNLEHTPAPAHAPRAPVNNTDAIPLGADEALDVADDDVVMDDEVIEDADSEIVNEANDLSSPETTIGLPPEAPAPALAPELPVPAPAVAKAADDLFADLPAPAPATAQSVADLMDEVGDEPMPLAAEDDLPGLVDGEPTRLEPAPTLAPPPSAAALDVPALSDIPDDLPAAASVEHFDGDGAEGFEAPPGFDDEASSVEPPHDETAHAAVGAPDDLPGMVSEDGLAYPGAAEEDGLPAPLALDELSASPLMQTGGDDMPTPLEAEDGDLPDVDELPKPALKKSQTDLRAIPGMADDSEDSAKLRTTKRKRVGLVAGIAAASLLILGGGGLFAYQQATGLLPWQEPPPPPPPPVVVKPLPPVPDLSTIEGRDLRALRAALAVLAERKTLAKEQSKTLPADDTHAAIKILWRGLAFNGESSFETELLPLLKADRTEPPHPELERADVAMALLQHDDAAFTAKSSQLLARDNGDPDILLLKGLHAMHAGKWADAAAQFQLVLPVRPKSVDALLGLARVSKKTEDAEAQEWLKKAEATDTDNARIKLVKAELSEADADVEAVQQVRDQLGTAEAARLDALRATPLAKKGRLREARVALDSALAAAATPQLLRHRAWLFVSDNQPDKALETYAKAEALDSNGDFTESILVGRVTLLVRQKDLAEAKRFLDVAVKSKVEKRSLAYAQALILEAENKLPLATKVFAQSAKFDKTFVLPLLALERIVGKKLAAQVRAARLGALVKKIPDARAYVAWGDALAEADSHSAAADAYGEAFTKNPWTIEAPEVLTRRIAALDRAGRSADAAWLRAMNLDVDVKDEASASNLLLIAVEAGDADLAERTAKQVLELRPKDQAAIVAMAEAKALRGDRDGAREALNKAIKAQPSAMAHYALAKLAMPKDPEGARINARKASDLDDKRAAYPLLMAQALVLKQKFDDARDAFARAIELDPKNVQAWLSAAKLHVQMDRKGEAINAYEKVVALAAEKLEYHIALGDLYIDAGQKDKAATHLQNALKRFPNSSEVVGRLGRLQQSLGNRGPAMKLYQQAIKLSPNDPQAHYYLAYLYKDGGQNAAALREFEAYLKLNPEADDAKDIKAEIEDLRK